MRMQSVLYPITALLIPFAIRLVPELLSLYPIGFDTIAYYIPIMLSRLALTASPTDYFGGTILLYLPLTIAYLLLGNALLTMKIAPALLLGFLGLSAYFVGKDFLEWKKQRALLLSILLCSYFVTLRISWDLQRNILGLAFALLTLAFIERPNTRLRYVLLPISAALAVATHESAAVLVTLIAAASLSLNRRYLDPRSYLPFVPAAVLLILQLLLRHNLLSQIQETVSSTDVRNAFTYNLGFVIFGFWLLLPLALIGIKRAMARHFSLWTLVCLIFGLLPNIGFPTGSPYRWILILVVPLIVLFIQGADTLLSAKRIWRRRFGRLVVAGFLLLSIAFSSGYLGLNGTTRSYFDIAPQYHPLMPVTMVESTVPIRDISSIVTIAHWANRTLPRSAVLILPFQLYGWYVTIVSGNRGFSFRPAGEERNIDDTISSIKPKTGPNPIYARNVDLFQPQDETVLANLAQQHSDAGLVYVVWWSSNSTEVIPSNLPSAFAVAFTTGNLAVYNFSKA
jgi:hypothetical protein